MYTGDSLFIQVNGELCKAIYLTQGLKQGCNLSPLFFNLLMIDMAREITNSKEGCKLGGKVFLGALFADNLRIVSTSRSSLERLLAFLLAPARIGAGTADAHACHIDHHEKLILFSV